jgi:hypothetical protein
MTRQRTPRRSQENGVVDFEFERRTYQIDPRHKKVYRRFVEIETSKAAEIFSLWRAQAIQA